MTLLGDHSAVMFHDGRVNRTTDGKGRLKTLSAQDVEKLDAGSWFSEDFTGERVPGLQETLELIIELGLGLNLELKPNRCNLKKLVDVVVQTLEDTDFPEEKLLVSSFNHKALMLFRNRSSARIGCLYESLPFNWQYKAQQVNAVAIHLNGWHLKERQVKGVKAAGYEIYCYTVNDSEKAEQLSKMGVDGVFSDNPELITV